MGSACTDGAAASGPTVHESVPQGEDARQRAARAPEPLGVEAEVVPLRALGKAGAGAVRRDGGGRRPCGDPSRGA